MCDAISLVAAAHLNEAPKTEPEEYPQWRFR
jgi:hypothetical protein